jgi:predicted TIM-barrel fold metal-dependent hydrolase
MTATPTFIIDSDSHVVEPKDLWSSRMSKKKWGDLIPEVRSVKGEGEFWFVRGQRLWDVNGAGVMVSDADGKPVRNADYPQFVNTFDEMHPAEYDAKERVKVLDEYGIYAATLFPNLGFVSADVYGRGNPAEYKTAALQAYNDYIGEWASEAPGRLLAMACLPYWDADAAVAEIERLAEKGGYHGLVTTGMPQLHSMPVLTSHYWDNMWAAAQDSGLSINFHVGGGNVSDWVNEERLEVEGFRVCFTRAITGGPQYAGITLNDLLMSGVLPRYPRLKFVMTESGFGHITFCLEALDYAFKKMEVWKDRPEFEKDGMLPSDYFKRQVYANFWFEEVTPWHLERLGEDNLMFETDFPHTTSIIGDEIPAALEHCLGGLPDDVVQKLTWKNAANVYNVDLPVAS